MHDMIDRLEQWQFDKEYPQFVPIFDALNFNLKAARRAIGMGNYLTALDRIDVIEEIISTLENQS